MGKGDKVRLLVSIEHRWSLVKERQKRNVLAPGAIGEITEGEQIHWEYNPETAFTKFLGFTVRFVMEGMPPVWVKLRSTEIELIEAVQV